MSPAGIRRATAADLTTVTGILAAAFQDGDLADWLIPDPGRRRRVYPPYFAMLAAHALTHGHVDLVEDTACALWYDTPAGPIDNYDQRLAAITGPALHRFQTLDRAMAAHHPDGAHAYLAFLAVTPSHQSRGHGSALLTHHHTRLGGPAFLEATGSRNQALYARHGYSLLGSYRITTDGPLLHPMTRTSADAHDDPPTR
ncbi:GNAT family N-acetyltransferase [Actinoplanes sp. HUAS TT8]|uniref:GNAT family N-acetyltransferase n=1 Tax=Actinoplanes sp. HUAS TT8 TaxID=3447453 RepID=UPI003F51BD18